MLSECESNATGRDLAQAVGDVEVQYGQFSEAGAEKTKMAFRSVA